MLKELHLQQVGPAAHFDVAFADRLNIFTGDNGLGKSFLLDIAWWVMTTNWAEQPAYPQRVRGENPQITAVVSNKKNITEYQSHFDFSEQQWRNLQMPPLLKEVVIYVRVDGSFSIFDPARQRDIPFDFNPNTLWNGLKSKDKVICNGLIQDWVTWQNQPNKYPFELFSNVIKKLAPHPSEWIEVGETTRVSIEDVRDIPTVNLPYGNVPVTQTSAGMKRILGLAYLLVWTWYEHKKASELRQQKPVNQIVLLIDEIESHLHPRWQRVILPAILSVVTELQPRMKIQALVTTHSPLILASLEPNFHEQEDKLFLFKLQDREVSLDEVPWSKQGDIVGWLTSDIFGLKQARSKEAEIAIEAAEAWMRDDDMNAFPENLRIPTQIHQELQRVLPGHDPFLAPLDSYNGEKKFWVIRGITQMMPFNPPPEPPDFDKKVRQPGNAWLGKNPDPKKGTRDYWSPFKSDLADGFNNLCGYSVMYEPVGTVDHYRSRENYRNLAYEWSNLRFASAWINSSKGTLDDQVLDPLDLGEDWFEILLPSLQLVLTDKVPPQQRQKAEFTLERLRLRDDERVLRQRQQWYQLYLDGDLTLQGLEKKAPLIARAIKKQQEAISQQ